MPTLKILFSQNTTSLSITDFLFNLEGPRLLEISDFTLVLIRATYRWFRIDSEAYWFYDVLIVDLLTY